MFGTGGKRNDVISQLVGLMLVAGMPAYRKALKNDSVTAYEQKGHVPGTSRGESYNGVDLVLGLCCESEAWSASSS